MKARDGADYFHFVEAVDDAPDLLSRRDWFKKYTEETKRVGGGDVRVVALDTVAETKSSR